jgi:hypothetical protein
LKETIPQDRDHLLPPVPVDVTKGETLTQGVSECGCRHLLGGHIARLRSTVPSRSNPMKGGRERRAAIGAKPVRVSAIGADPHSKIPKARTKALGEEAVSLSRCYRHSTESGVLPWRWSVQSEDGTHRLNFFPVTCLYFPYLAKAILGSSPYTVCWRYRPTGRYPHQRRSLFLLLTVKEKSSKPSDLRLKASFLTSLRWSYRDPHTMSHIQS